MSRDEHTIIIGAGQSGLVMSHFLQLKDIPHTLIERARVAERWRSERWDSLYFQFPNRFLRLPGMSHQSEAPDAFTHRDGVVDFLERYAAQIAAPVRCGVAVEALATHASGGFRLETSMGPMRADNVVVATGPYQSPAIPPFASGLTSDIAQLPASRYTNPGALPPGNVLVVGSGASGVQIADDLISHGRTVYLSVGRHRRIPRRYNGKDAAEWSEALGLFDVNAANLPAGWRAPLITGVNGGYDVDLRAMARRGLVLLGRVQDGADNQLTISDDLDQHLDAGDATYDDAVARIEAFIRGTPPPTPVAPGHLDTAIAEQSFDLAAEGVSSIIWATGYKYDFGWLPDEAVNDAGAPLHERGVASLPGLYFLGLFGLSAIRSSLFWGVADDAARLADVIADAR
ncbi:MAG: NAD(P)/FAD-dependent oxidoreductase [Pseudomonadota bacterium]